MRLFLHHDLFGNSLALFPLAFHLCLLDDCKVSRLWLLLLLDKLLHFRDFFLCFLLSFVECPCLEKNIRYWQNEQKISPLARSLFCQRSNLIDSILRRVLVIWWLIVIEHLLLLVLLLLLVEVILTGREVILLPVKIKEHPHYVFWLKIVILKSGSVFLKWWWSIK